MSAGVAGEGESPTPSFPSISLLLTEVNFQVVECLGEFKSRLAGFHVNIPPP